MTKKFLTFAILFIVLAGVFAPIFSIAQGPAAGMQQTVNQSANGTLGKDIPPQEDTSGWGPANWILKVFFKGIGQFLMMISSFVLIFSGMIFDWILKFTIVDMAKNIGGSAGVGAGITQAWATLRDIANMCFIFVLLYAAFKTMFDSNFGNFQTTIKNIIIVALLINFSLFFSKVVIDASNIVAVGFYNSITVNSYPISGNKLIAAGATVTGTEKSISGGYMKMLGVNTFYGSDILEGQTDAKNILLIGITSSIFMLITAVILLIAGIMFAARFIILIFLMILSPLALIAYAIPGQSKHFDDWFDALKNQSFFAPLYFALTWVVFKLGSSLLATIKVDPNLGTQSPNFSNMFNSPGSAVAMIINYVLIIGFSIAALIFAKTMATKGAAGTAFKSVAGGIGTGVIGGAALAGRNVIGRGSGLVSEKYRDSWSKNSFGRAGLWLADKGKKGSFDVRATETLSKVPGLGKELDIMGKAGGKGGFAKAVDDKVKAKAQYAKDVYGQTDREKEEFERKKKEEEGRVRTERATKEAETKTEAGSAEKKRKEYVSKDEKIKEHSDTLTDLNEEKKDKQIKLKLAKNAGKTSEAEELNKELGSIASRIANEREARKEREKEIEETDEIYKKLKEDADEKKEAAKEAKSKSKKKEIDDDELTTETQRLKNAGKERQDAYAERVRGNLELAGNVAAARKIKEQAKGKSNKDKAADLLKAMKEDEDKASGTAPATPIPAAPAAPPPAASPSS